MSGLTTWLRCGLWLIGLMIVGVSPGLGLVTLLLIAQRRFELASYFGLILLLGFLLMMCLDCPEAVE